MEHFSDLTTSISLLIADEGFAVAQYEVEELVNRVRERYISRKIDDANEFCSKDREIEELSKRLRRENSLTAIDDKIKEFFSTFTLETRMKEIVKNIAFRIPHKVIMEAKEIEELKSRGLLPKDVKRPFQIKLQSALTINFDELKLNSSTTLWENYHMYRYTNDIELLFSYALGIKFDLYDLFPMENCNIGVVLPYKDTGLHFCAHKNGIIHFSHPKMEKVWEILKKYAPDRYVFI